MKKPDENPVVKESDLQTIVDLLSIRMEVIQNGVNEIRKKLNMPEKRIGEGSFKAEEEEIRECQKKKVEAFVNKAFGFDNEDHKKLSVSHKESIIKLKK